MKKTIKILGIITAILGFMCCDVIDKDRLIEVKQSERDSITKNVLLIDFTDQDCMNCFQAADMIRGFDTIFGGALIAVSVHATTKTGALFTLVTPEGKEYDEFFNNGTYTHPMGTIDGQKPAIDRNEWRKKIEERLEMETPVGLELDCDYIPEKGKIYVHSKMTSSEKIDSLQLFLWIIESKIVAVQKMGDGKLNPNYVHNHIFRAAINGTWGEYITLEKDIKLEKYHTYILDKTLSKPWNPENISIVGFLYDKKSSDDHKVYQTKEIHLINKEEEEHNL